MLKIKSHMPRYTASVDVHDLPDGSFEAVAAFAQQHENMHDYADGGYYPLPDFDLLSQDQTPEDQLAQFAAGTLDEDDYPIKDWAETLEDFQQYIAWLRALRFITANVPEGTLAGQRLAVYVWH